MQIPGKNINYKWVISGNQNLYTLVFRNEYQGIVMEDKGLQT